MVPPSDEKEVQMRRISVSKEILGAHPARMPIIANPSAASVVRAMGFQGSEIGFRH